MSCASSEPSSFNGAPSFAASMDWLGAAIDRSSSASSASSRSSNWVIDCAIARSWIGGFTKLSAEEA